LILTSKCKWIGVVWQASS